MVWKQNKFWVLFTRILDEYTVKESKKEQQRCKSQRIPSRGFLRKSFMWEILELRRQWEHLVFSSMHTGWMKTNLNGREPLRTGHVRGGSPRSLSLPVLGSGATLFLFYYYHCFSNLAITSLFILIIYIYYFI